MLNPASLLSVVAGSPVIGADGERLGMVSAVRPTPAAASHILVFFVERQWLLPREYPLPVTAIRRFEDGALHVDCTREVMRAALASAPLDSIG